MFKLIFFIFMYIHYEENSRRSRLYFCLDTLTSESPSVNETLGETLGESFNPPVISTTRKRARTSPEDQITLFERPPRAQKRSKFKNFCAHHQANDQTSVLSTEKVQKAQLGPKLWAFEKKL